MSAVTEITNIVGDLETYADELGAEGWYNAANACRYAGAEIERLRAALQEIADLDRPHIGTYSALVRAYTVARRALEGKCGPGPE